MDRKEFEEMIQGLSDEQMKMLYAFLKQMYREKMIKLHGSAAARAILERMKEHPEEENAILDEAEAEALKDDSFQQYILKEEKGNDH